MKEKVIGIFEKTRRRDFAITLSSTLGFSALIFLLSPGVASANAFVDALVSGADLIFGNIFEAAMRLLAWIMSLLTSIGGQFLDMAIRYSINGSNLRITGVIQGWVIFRDLVNMLFIFILLYLSIMTILQISNVNTRKVIVNLVLVGIFINFSFFFTGFVIDVGNSLSTTLYNAVTPGNTEISAILIDRMDLAKLKDGVSNTGNNFQSGLAYLMNAIFFAVAGFVFIAGGFLFIVRHVSLLFILMLSPLAFAAIILPQTQRHWKKWLNTLLENTFVAPAYLLMVVVTITIASAGDLLVSGGGPDLKVGVNNEFPISMLDTPGLLLNYIVIIGLMIGSITVAKSVSGSLAGTATKWAGKVTGAGTGFAYRNTVGRAARRFGDSDTLTKMEAKGGMRGYAARKAMQLSDAGASASGDMRGGLRSLGIDAGASSGKGGYAAVAKREQKRADERIKRAGEARVSAGDYRDVDKTLKVESESDEVRKAKTMAREALKEGDYRGYLKHKKTAVTTKAGDAVKPIGRSLQQGKNLIFDRNKFKEHRKKNKENRAQKKVEYAKRRAELIDDKLQDRKDTALGSKKQVMETKYEVEDGKLLNESEALITPATYKRNTAGYPIDSSGNAVASDVDKNPINPSEAAVASPAQYRGTKKEVAKEGHWYDKENKITTDESKAARNKDGTQEQLMQSYSRNTFFGKLFGTATPQRAAVENQRRKKPELDQIKKILKIDEKEEAPTPPTAPEPDAPTGGGTPT